MVDFVLIFALLLVFFAGIVFVFVFNWLVERRAFSITQQKNNAKMQNVKQEEADELMQFLLEVKTAYDTRPEGQEMKEFMAKGLAPIALQHPRILIRYGSRLKKLLEKQGINGLAEGLL